MTKRRTVKNGKRHGGAKEGLYKKKRSVVLKTYSTANIGRMALANIAARERGVLERNAKSRLNKRMRGLAGRLTKKLGKKTEKEARTGIVHKYKRQKLRALIAFLERLEKLDDMALEIDNNDLRTRLSIFVMAVMGELEETFETIKEMLPRDHEMSSNIDDLIGAISGMTVNNQESIEDIIEDAKNILKALKSEYNDEDLMEEARELYGGAIDLLVERFILAIEKHQVELMAVSEAPAGNNVSGLLDLFSDLGL